MVTIWGTTTCSFCERAKDLCKQYDLQFEYITIDSQEKLAELHEIAPGTKTVPQIWWNGNYIGGYSEFATEIENTRNFGQETI